MNRKQWKLSFWNFKLPTFNSTHFKFQLIFTYMTEKHTVKEDTGEFSNNIISSIIQGFDPSKAHGHDKG